MPFVGGGWETCAEHILALLILRLILKEETVIFSFRGEETAYKGSTQRREETIK